MYKLSDFQPGDLLVITSRSKAGEERRAAIVTTVNHNNNGQVAFAGWSTNGILPAGQGAFDPAKVGTTPYGLTVAVEKVGHQKPSKSYGLEVQLSRISVSR